MFSVRSSFYEWALIHALHPLSAEIVLVSWFEGCCKFKLLSVVLGQEHVSTQVRRKALYHSGGALDVLWMYRRQRPNRLDMCFTTTHLSIYQHLRAGHHTTHEYCLSAVTDIQQETAFCKVTCFRVKRDVIWDQMQGRTWFNPPRFDLMEKSVSIWQLAEK